MLLVYFSVTVLLSLGARTTDAVACPGKAADIVFILDSSCSVNQQDNTNFDRFKSFMINITKSLTVGVDMVHIGVIRYSQISEKMFGLDTYTTQDNVVSAINNITYKCSSTNTHLALKMVREDFFIGSGGDRTELPNIAIVLTDGKSEDTTATANQATLAHTAGIYVIAVGVTGANQAELNAMGTDPDSESVAYVQNFPDIASIEDTITERCCQVSEVPIFCVTEECFAASGGRNDAAYLKCNTLFASILIFGAMWMTYGRQ